MVRDAAENPTPNEKKIGASAQKARQKQAVLVHPRSPHSYQTYAPNPATAKALAVLAKLMDGEEVIPKLRAHPEISESGSMRLSRSRISVA